MLSNMQNKTLFSDDFSFEVALKFHCTRKLSCCHFSVKRLILHQTLVLPQLTSQVLEELQALFTWHLCGTWWHRRAWRCFHWSHLFSPDIYPTGSGTVAGGGLGREVGVISGTVWGDTSVFACSRNLLRSKSTDNCFKSRTQIRSYPIRFPWMCLPIRFSATTQQVRSHCRQNRPETYCCPCMTHISVFMTLCMTLNSTNLTSAP